MARGDLHPDGRDTADYSTSMDRLPWIGTNTRNVRCSYGAGRSRANSFARAVNESPKPGEVQQHRPNREPVEYSGMRNKRSVWTVATQPFPEAHFATFPEKLIWPCVLAGSPEGGNVFDPFGGSRTTGVVARKLGRKFLLIEMGPTYIEIAERRIQRETAQMNIFEFGT